MTLEVQSSRDQLFESATLRSLPDVLRFAKSLESDVDAAADLVQETCLRAWKARATFDEKRDIRQWLFAICANLFLRTRERSARMVSVEDDAELETLANVHLHKAAQSGNYEDVFSRMDFAPALDRALAKLPEQYRIVFALVDIGDHTYSEAAALLGLPVGTIRSRLFRARRELQVSMIEYARDAGLRPSAGEDSK